MPINQGRNRAKLNDHVMAGNWLLGMESRWFSANLANRAHRSRYFSQTADHSKRFSIFYRLSCGVCGKQNAPSPDRRRQRLSYEPWRRPSQGVATPVARRSDARRKTRRRPSQGESTPVARRSDSSRKEKRLQSRIKATPVTVTNGKAPPMERHVHGEGRIMRSARLDCGDSRLRFFHMWRHSACERAKSRLSAYPRPPWLKFKSKQAQAFAFPCRFHGNRH